MFYLYHHYFRIQYTYWYKNMNPWWFLIFFYFFYIKKVSNISDYSVFNHFVLFQSKNSFYILIKLSSIYFISLKGCLTSLIMLLSILLSFSSCKRLFLPLFYFSVYFISILCKYFYLNDSSLYIMKKNICFFFDNKRQL